MRILFVCIENSGRSQMAEAFARRLGGGRVEAFSAGSRPSGTVHPKTLALMREIGYDLGGHRSKGLGEVPQGPYDFVITMGCGDACPWIPARNHIEWDIPDPKNLPDDEFRKVRDQIAAKVEDLITNETRFQTDIHD